MGHACVGCWVAAAAVAASSWDFIVLVALIALGRGRVGGWGCKKAASTGAASVAFIARSGIFIFICVYTRRRNGFHCFGAAGGVGLLGGARAHYHLLSAVNWDFFFVGLSPLFIALDNWHEPCARIYGHSAVGWIASDNSIATNAAPTFQSAQQQPGPTTTGQALGTTDPCAHAIQCIGGSWAAVECLICLLSMGHQSWHLPVLNWTHINMCEMR